MGSDSISQLTIPIILVGVDVSWYEPKDSLDIDLLVEVVGDQVSAPSVDGISELMIECS